MSETTEKIYCNDNNCAEMMALMNNNNNWMNNPFMYLIWLAFFGGGNGFGWGNKNQDSGQIAQLQDTVNTNHNNDLAMQAIQGNATALHELAGNLNLGVGGLQAAINNVQSVIQQVGAQNGMGQEKVINSIILGNKDLVQQIATCCCENKQLVTQMGYEGQIRDLQNTQTITGRIDQLANGIQTGFASVGYETQSQTNALQNSLQAQTQTIIDKINNLESNAQQDKINSLTAQLTAANSRAERAAELAPIIQQLNNIKASQPNTVAVQYPQLTVFPSYLNTAAQNYYYNGGFWG